MKLLEPGSLERKEISHHPNMSVGDEYVVLHIVSFPDRPSELALLDSEGNSNGQWPAEMFETVSREIPSNWVASIDEDGVLAVAPEAFLRPMFWHHLDNDRGSTREEVLRAVADYKREREIIMRES